jgi:PKD repeat protein
MIAKLITLMLIVFSIVGLAIVPAGGGFTQWVVVGGGNNNNPYYLMQQQAYATEAEPEVPEEEEEGGGTVAPPTPLTASISIDSTNGDTAPATFLFETQAEGGTEPYTYSWNFGDGSPPVIEQNLEHTFVNPGTYVVSLTVTDSTGQTVSDTGEVIVRPATTTTTGEEPQPPPTNTTTPTEPGPPTQNQTQFEQNQTGTTGAAGAIQCPPGSVPAGSAPSPRVGGVRGPIVLASGSTSVQFSVSGGTWSNAAIVTNHPWGPPISGTQYISSNAMFGVASSPSGDTWYRVTFTLPSGFSNPSLNGQIHVDNSVEIYLNSPSNTFPPPQVNRIPITLPGGQSNFLDPPETFTFNEQFIMGKGSVLFVPGQNTLYFKVINQGGPTGLDFLVNIDYCQPTPGSVEEEPEGPTGTGTVPPPPTPPIPTGLNVTCPASNVQHWDKIMFVITDSAISGSLGFITETQLDIKVLDDPTTVADIEKKVLDFLKLPDNPQNRNAIAILDVEYAIICAR